MSLLDGIAGPADVRALPESALPTLAGEIRERLIESVCRTGGHLGPNLGVVELTIAVHRVFESPHDTIVWDTGHQAYVHKMLTGRHGDFAGLRQAGGLSGYPQRAESEHDHVENSHASTALSYADGLAKAYELRGLTDRTVVAIVGDGAMTGGMCWEALNNIAAAPHRPIVIVLNDNGRSYSPTAGALATHLSTLRAGDCTSLFEQLGMAYLGPVDGHDTIAVEAALRKARETGLPTVVHCVTRKGLGHLPAETDDADRMHSIGPVKSTGGTASGGTSTQTWTDVFADEMLSIGAQRDDVVALTAAMLGPTGLQAFALRYPHRTFDVGIAEQHAVTSAAGLAMGGLHPVVAVYSTFLNRALDQTLMDVALHRQPVTFVLDRAGITGTDGPSHHGMWDLTLLGMVPGMRVAAPRDAASLCAELREAVEWSAGPTALRFPKADVADDVAAVRRVGVADILRDGERPEILLIAVGALAGAAVAAADELADRGVAVTVADPRWLLPVDPELVRESERYGRVVTVEDSGEHGGFGDAFARALRAAGVPTPVQTIALAQQFVPHGSRGSILSAAGLDGPGIAAAVVG
ncbi:MAG TPA: 1-deoxy-D-xylulose-5-phosphate synthase [Micromonosporaceae bacterium]|nr:1-deoxy-D-xylulose-5-phosphate synthase [Micromonosporaceae bacterium]